MHVTFFVSNRIWIRNPSRGAKKVSGYNMSSKLPSSLRVPLTVNLACDTVRTVQKLEATQDIS
jgi:hypothetical protein